MAKNVDYELQDAAVLDKTVEDNYTDLSAKGFNQQRKEKLHNSIVTARTKETAQQKAVKHVNEKTAGQNTATEQGTQLIVKIQNAAKSAYGSDPASLKRYRIGETKPRGIGGLLSWMNYFQTLLVENDDDLLANGLMQEDITAFGNCLTVLTSADTVQENAKKLQKAATLARDSAVEAMKEEVNKTRSFVKAAFQGNKEMLVKFKPIPKGRVSSDTQESAQTTTETSNTTTTPGA